MIPLQKIYPVVIIGGGASGTSLFYALAKYTTIPDVVLLEKYEKPGQVNSRSSNNSQTLHVGDIETNYPLEKVTSVHPAAMMVAYYANNLPEEVRKKIIAPVSKMVLGVGETEVALLEKRYAELITLFPDLQKLDASGIQKVEPAVMNGRDPHEPVLALYTEKGYSVDFENLSQSFINETARINPTYEARFKNHVESISKNDDDTYCITIREQEPIIAQTVVVDTDSYSLLFAKQMGYGKEFSLIPIAGSFYFSKQLLNGKVYTVQEPRLPFAAVHGDPDIRVPNVTRWGPTARFYPVLESRNSKTFFDYIKSSGLESLNTWVSFFKILLDPIRFTYLVKNMLYELPWIGKRMFLSHVKKIVPTIKASDVTLAQGYGGMRLQRVDTRTHELQLGEGKIIEDKIIFNMTPSPGASVCLYNAMRDVEHLITFLDSNYSFNKKSMEHDLLCSSDTFKASVTLPEGYAS